MVIFCYRAFLCRLLRSYVLICPSTFWPFALLFWFDFWAEVAKVVIKLGNCAVAIEFCKLHYAIVLWTFTVYLIRFFRALILSFDSHLRIHGDANCRKCAFIVGNTSSMTSSSAKSNTNDWAKLWKQFGRKLAQKKAVVVVLPEKSLSHIIFSRR